MKADNSKSVAQGFGSTGSVDRGTNRSKTDLLPARSTNDIG